MTQSAIQKVQKFMKDAQGRYRTESLFFETSRDRTKYPPLFTLKERSHEGCMSLYELYMKSEDPTEHLFATSTLGSYAHWQKLCSLKWFAEHVIVWRDHLDAAMKSTQIARMTKMADEGNAVAAKWLAARGWEEKQGKRGRPNNAELERELKKRADHFESVEDDAQRMQM